MRAFTQLTWLMLPLLAANAAAATNSAPTFDMALTALGDDANSSSFDVSATLTPSERWSLSAGGGSSNNSSSASRVSGSSFHGSADVHLGEFGVRPGYSHWSDNDNFSSATPQLALYWKHQGFQAELLAEWPKFALDYQLRILAQTVTRRFEYSGNGLGAGLEYYGAQWGGYINGLSYSYGDDITRLRSLSQSSNLQKFPRLALLVRSMATLTQGSLKDKLSAGLERDFSRFAIHADLTRVTDALSDSQADSYGLGANFIVNERLGIDASGDVTHAEGFDDAAFASLTFSVHW
jgi:hypothetical protein